MADNGTRNLTLAVGVDTAPLKVLEDLTAKIAYHLGEISLAIGNAVRQLDAAREPAAGFLLESDGA